MNRKIYCFIRTDIPLTEQVVAMGHAIYQMADYYQPTCPEIPALVLIQLGDEKQVSKVIRLLTERNIFRYAWSDPDDRSEPHKVTAIATVPLDDEVAKVLANYRLWIPECTSKA